MRHPPRSELLEIARHPGGHNRIPRESDEERNRKLKGIGPAASAKDDKPTKPRFARLPVRSVEFF